MFESSSRQAGGVFELTLRPGDYGYADVYLERLEGYATVAPVPLPAGLPLALAGFAPLAALARAKSGRAAARPKKRLRHCIPARNH